MYRERALVGWNAQVPARDADSAALCDTLNPFSVPGYRQHQAVRLVTDWCASVAIPQPVWKISWSFGDSSDRSPVPETYAFGAFFRNGEDCTL